MANKNAHFLSPSILYLLPNALVQTIGNDSQVTPPFRAIAGLIRLIETQLANSLATICWAATAD